MPTNAVILANAPIACVLAGNDVAKGSLFGQRLDSMLPIKMYVTYTIIKKIYDNNSTYVGMDAACLYLWELMGRWGVMAQYYTGGGSVAPITPVYGFVYRIPIFGSDFADATNYNNPKIVGKSLGIFWNDINRDLLPSEYQNTALGVQILIDGFDAVANPTYYLVIYINNPTL